MSESATRRVRSYDADATRTAILNAAEAIFAEHGFDGARIDAIAARSGYNKSLIFQYFVDKLNLYAEVLKRAEQQANALRAQIFAPLLADPQLAADPQQLRDFFVMAFAAIFDHLLAHPKLLRILHWEQAEGWKTYARISQQVQIEQYTRLEELFQQGYQAGLLRSAFVPALQLSLALQLCQSFLASLPLYQGLLPATDLSSTAGLAQARDYIVGFIVAGMLVDPASHS